MAGFEPLLTFCKKLLRFSHRGYASIEALIDRLWIRISGIEVTAVHRFVIESVAQR
jgi:hypothetical protein